MGLVYLPTLKLLMKTINKDSWQIGKYTFRPMDPLRLGDVFFWLMWNSTTCTRLIFLFVCALLILLVESWTIFILHLGFGDHLFSTYRIHVLTVYIYLHLAYNRLLVNV